MKKICALMIIMLMVVSVFPNFRVSADENNQELQGNNEPQKQNIVKNLGNGKLQVGNIIIDEIKNEAIVPGRINMKEGIIEFIACTKGGMKAYESALEMDTDAKSFNLSMILLGLDPKKGKTSAYHFDPNPPEGDGVEIYIQWDTDKGKKTIMAQEVIHDMKTGKTFPTSHWVYTGSIFMENGIYLADEAGVLIGFVHDPASIIESPLSNGAGSFGSLVVNSSILPEVSTKIQMIIKPFEKVENKKQEIRSKMQDTGNEKQEKEN